LHGDCDHGFAVAAGGDSRLFKDNEKLPVVAVCIGKISTSLTRFN